MVSNDEDMKTLIDWGLASDNETSAQVMYEIYLTDLRETVATINNPTLVLGAWIAYKNYGVTKEMIMHTFQEQYMKLEGTEIKISETGKHFLMWDDPEWFFDSVTQFLTDKY